MKKLITTLAFTAVCVGAFAQGKVSFLNDSLHTYYLGTVQPADAALAGLRTPVNGTLPSGATLVADLYAGTTAGSLTLVSTTTMSAVAPGRQNTSSVVLPIAGGVAQFFQVQIRQNSFATAALAEQGGGYFGYSDIFTAIPGTGAGYNSIVQTTSPAFSTWPVGSLDLSGVGGALAGTRGAINVSSIIVPEPSSMVLAGLGAASLLMLRRKN